jgi:ankyrin repeat protein
VAFLLSKGANATIQGHEGLTPLMEASRGQRVGVARLLLKHMGRDGDLSAFIEASIGGYLGVARLLLEHMGGQGLDTTDNEGMTALHHAAFEGLQELVSFLLAKGADPNTTSLDGRTALACACKEFHWPVVLLLATHMDQHALETRDSEGRTPLYLAWEQGNRKWVKLLLLGGADHTTTDNQGRRPPGFDEDLLPVSAAPAHLLVSHKDHFAKSCCGYLFHQQWLLAALHGACVLTPLIDAPCLLLAVVGGRAGAPLPPLPGEGSSGRCQGASSGPSYACLP